MLPTLICEPVSMITQTRCAVDRGVDQHQPAEAGGGR